LDFSFIYLQFVVIQNCKCVVPAGSKFAEIAFLMPRKIQVFVQGARNHTKMGILMTMYLIFRVEHCHCRPQMIQKQTITNMSMMKRNQTGEFDHNKWLFETKGTYGYGNAYWPQDDMYGDDGNDGFQGGMMESNDKPWKPLSRRIPIPQGIISPYR
jgi:hypothetical protein